MNVLPGIDDSRYSPVRGGTVIHVLTVLQPPVASQPHPGMYVLEPVYKASSVVMNIVASRDVFESPQALLPGAQEAIDASESEILTADWMAE